MRSKPSSPTLTKRRVVVQKGRYLHHPSRYHSLQAERNDFNPLHQPPLRSAEFHHPFVVIAVVVVVGLDRISITAMRLDFFLLYLLLLLSTRRHRHKDGGGGNGNSKKEPAKKSRMQLCALPVNGMCVRDFADYRFESYSWTDGWMDGWEVRGILASDVHESAGFEFTGA